MSDQSSPPRDRYWAETVERDGLRAALSLVLSRIAFFKANTDEPSGEGWSHLNETEKLVGECLEVAPKRKRRRR